MPFTNCDIGIQKSHSELKQIVDMVIFLRSLGLSFKWWDRDDSQHHPNVGKYSCGYVGNFIECLWLGGGDENHENHSNTCSNNATYISKIPRMS